MNTFVLNPTKMLILLLEDEIPQPFQKVENHLFKTQHEAKFLGKGVSVALVFRSVKALSIFDGRMHCWLWEDLNTRMISTKRLKEAADKLAKKFMKPHKNFSNGFTENQWEEYHQSRKAKEGKIREDLKMIMQRTVECLPFHSE